jgi:hypothetical protein
MSLDTLDDLLVQQLRDLYSAERQIVRTLPKLVTSGEAFHVRDVLAMPSDRRCDPWEDLLASRQRLSRAVIAHLE